ncbi:arginine--tRNA ligase [Salisaeta longa]|uniref:arginine--tRNA ligase n=1 Tax=Salisaeta longa TaxID=503170 RepID=UPI0003B42E34|nr:arginine--tRNA ligase [Salisaeta longa]
MRDYLRQQLRTVLDALDAVPDDFEIELEAPARPEHGDLSTNTALRLAGVLQDNPRSIAETLAERLRAAVDPHRVAAVEVAGPGFINFRFATDYLYDELADLLAAGAAFGRSDEGEGQRALVEYVSANPTGPLTVGHGRNAVLGDTVANLLQWAGYDVTREYYYNDAGRQMRVLAQSVRARYEELTGAVAREQRTLDDGTVVTVGETFPDDGYLGDYITDIARSLQDEHGDALLDEDTLRPFQDAAEEVIFAEIEATLERLNISMDTFFNERSLYSDHRVERVVERLKAAGYTYESDDALWFETTRFGKDSDTVLIKSTGEPTYRTPDIAYHADKFDRGFDVIIDVLGADHIATYPDVISALEVLGYDADRVEVLLYQFVTLVRGGEPVKMSTRRANYVTLDELIDEVGADVTRFFFLMRAASTHLDFDLDLAAEASDKNPVFYLQYAHARICSIFDKAVAEGLSLDDAPDLSVLTHDAETDLIKELLRFPTVIQRAAEARAPHYVATYLRDVATAFSQFYGHCHIIGEAEALGTARLHLAHATRTVLANGLTVLGISAPESM